MHMVNFFLIFLYKCNQYNFICLYHVFMIGRLLLSVFLKALN